MMSSLILPFILVTAVAAIALLSWWLPQVNAQKRRELAQSLAGQRGWTYLANPAYDNHLIYLLVGHVERLQWELVGTKSRATSGRSRLPAGNRWRTEDARLFDDKVVIGAMPPNMAFAAGANVGQGISKFMMNLILAPYGVGDTSGLVSRPVGSSAFQQRFFVLSRQAETAQKVLSPTIEQELLHWPADSNPLRQPWIVLDEGGITIRVFDDRPAEESSRLDRLVYLGQFLAKIAHEG